MQKNVASQKAIFFAFDSTTNAPKTGDAANITPYESLDYGAVTGITDTSMTEMDSTNAKGYYICDLTQAETNGNTILFSGKSSTANIVVIGAPSVVQTVPASFIVAPGSAGALFVGGSNAATTIAGLTTGAIAATTITASGAVAFQSTFAVTTSSAFGALSCTTLTASGAVALQSTVGITGAVTLSSTLGVGATTLSALTVTNNLLVSGTATITGATTFTGAVGATNAGNDIRGVLLSGTQTFNLTGNITGNLSGSVGSVTGAVGSVTARVTADTDQLAGQTVTAAAGVTFPASIASPTNITAATGVVLTSAGSAAMAELTGDPGATPTLAQGVMLLYMATRNKRDTTSSDDTICNNAGGVILTAGLSDDTVTFEKTKYAP